MYSKQISLIESLNRSPEEVSGIKLVYLVKDTDLPMLGLVPKTKQRKMFSLGDDSKWLQVQEQLHCSQKFCSYLETEKLEMRWWRSVHHL